MRAMARSDHWRWVSTPRWVRTSGKVTSSCPRRTNHSRICCGSAAGSVPSKAYGVQAPWGSRINPPANEDGRFAGAVPDRRLGGEFHCGGGAVISGHCGAGPPHVGLVKEGLERGSPRALPRGATLLTRLTRRRGRIAGRVPPQSGDEGYRRGQGLAAVEQVQSGAGPGRRSPRRGTTTSGRCGSQRRSCKIICRAQSVRFLWRHPGWWYPAGDSTAPMAPAP